MIRIIDFAYKMGATSLELCERFFCLGQRHPTTHCRIVKDLEHGDILLAYYGPANATDEQLIEAYKDATLLPHQKKKKG